MEMMNFSDSIDVSLSYKTNKDISSIRTFECTKIFFSYSFHDIGYAKFLIILLVGGQCLSFCVGLKTPFTSKSTFEEEETFGKTP